MFLPDNIFSVEDNAAGKGLMSAIVEGVIIQTFLCNKVQKCKCINLVVMENLILSQKLGFLF